MEIPFEELENVEKSQHNVAYTRLSLCAQATSKFLKVILIRDFHNCRKT